MSTADEIIDFVRDYFDEPGIPLTVDTDLVAFCRERDEDQFSHFIEHISKRFRILNSGVEKHRPSPD